MKLKGLSKLPILVITANHANPNLHLLQSLQCPRFLLSMVSFDPIGLISPVLVPAKKFISSLWDKGFDWDEILPDELQQQYNQIAKEIEAASAFVTSRYLDFDKALPVEMHVFCDACPTTAAGCCVFFAQNEKVRFISSKVKLSSSKHARTVPQWELIAMVMCGIW